MCACLPKASTLTYPVIMSIDAMVGETLHMRMWQKKVPQTRLADRLGISQSTLSKKLRGQVKWSLDELYVVARALDVDVRDLLPHLDSNQKPFGSRSAA
jgi:transcriptional regulator with XRE-family HTH domain